MNFKMTKIAALAAMAFASTGAHAVLTSTNTLSIQGDATTVQTAAGSWTVGTDGPLADSFFTMGGAVTKKLIDGQFAYIYNAGDMTLTGATQSNLGTFTYYGAPGSNHTNAPGISILSASGDAATVDMSGWRVNWGTVTDIPMGGLAWGAGTNGVGSITCAAGSGCAVGSAYTLKYFATVPHGDASGFGDVKYYLELHGNVGGVTAAVPEASTYGMMLAGLGLVGFAVRRRKQVL